MKSIRNSVILLFSDKYNEVKRTLILSCLFSVVLVTARIIYTGSFLFIFLVWNLFLAFIPFFISDYITKDRATGKIKKILLALIWIAFLPNSFYIITDIFHLNMSEEMPLWYDLALLFSFAWNGVLFGIISIRQMEKLIEPYIDEKIKPLFLYSIMFLNAIGIYIGRYLRFNSWDVITDPVLLIKDIIYLLVHPLRNRFDWSMIICYFILLTLIYTTIKKLGKAL
ncbi:MAG TPA: DUF1361 domain-containing protein [Flavisolibacter sp.]|nr:DUF1361 domain-containing protein [Flavisolibacter sp.]